MRGGFAGSCGMGTGWLPSRATLAIPGKVVAGLKSEGGWLFQEGQALPRTDPEKLSRIWGHGTSRKLKRD